MKVIKYLYKGILVEMGWNEANEETAKKEAYKGEYTIEEVEVEEPAPTIEERTAALEEAINLLLEGATE